MSKDFYFSNWINYDEDDNYGYTESRYSENEYIESVFYIYDMPVIKCRIIWMEDDNHVFITRNLITDERISKNLKYATSKDSAKRIALQLCKLIIKETLSGGVKNEYDE